MPFDGLPRRLRDARKAAGLTQQDVAERLEVHPMSVSNWERGVTVPERERVAALAKLYDVEEAVLAYGWLPHRPNAPRADGFTPNPALKHRLPARAYDVVLGYLRRMEAAGCSEDQMDEAERLMVDGAFNKLNKRDFRERSEADVITDIDAAWDFIVFVLRKEGIRL